MKHLSFALPVFVMLWASAASAQIIGDPRCKTADYVAGRIDAIASTIKRVADAIETVPPADAEYLRNEKQLALEQNNPARFNVVASNRYFAALEFHDDYKVAADNLRAARSASGKQQATYLVVVLSRLASVDLSMRDYMAFDAKRARPFLNQEATDRFYFAMPSARGQITSLIQCVISQL